MKQIPNFVLWLFVACFALFQSDASAQKKPKVESVLKSLPEFFVNDNVLPPYLQQIYKKDATRLSLRLLNIEQRLSQQTVKVPEELVQAIYNAMIAVRISDYGAIDTIARVYGVRTFPVPNIETLILVFEHDAEWVKPLVERKDTTGSPTINRIIRQYNLVMTRMVYLDEERAGLVLQTQEPLNMPALAHKFFTEEGIGSIEEVLPYGDGNDINIVRTKLGWDLTYSIRFGNCVNQCQKSFNWKFTISESGEVAYAGGSGDTIPPWITAPTAAKKFPDVIKK